MVGLKPVVVHGGGPQISAMLRQGSGIPGEFRGRALRVTTPETMDIVRMVLVGQVGSRNSSALINQHGPYAVGIFRRGRATVHRRNGAAP